MTSHITARNLVKSMKSCECILCEHLLVAKLIYLSCHVIKSLSIVFVCNKL